MKSRMLRATLLSMVLLVGVLAGPALAEYPPAEPPEPPDQREDVVERDDEMAGGDQPAAEMPVTGSDAAGLSAAGLGLLALGGLALRRRSTPDLG